MSAPAVNGSPVDPVSRRSPPSSPAAPTPLDALRNSWVVHCEFGAGVTLLRTYTIRVTDSEWAGGTITYQAIDTSAGKAQMVGAATGTPDAMLDVRATVTDSGLHFSGFWPNGTLVVTSVFAVDGPMGLYPAVMTLHAEPPWDGAEQHYGGCDSLRSLESPSR